MKYQTRMILGYLAGGLLVLVIVPFVIYFVTLLADHAFRIRIIPGDPARWITAAVLLATGFFFGISSIIIQNVVGKGGPLEISNIEISPKTKKLVETGPYRFTRNPMLFGTFLIYLALAVLINSVTALLLVAAFAVFMLTVVVKKEEARLARDFGKRYERYRKRTSMIIPWFPRKRR